MSISIISVWDTYGTLVGLWMASHFQDSMTVSRCLGFSNYFVIDGKAPGYNFCGSGNPKSSRQRFLSKMCTEHTLDLSVMGGSFPLIAIIHFSLKYKPFGIPWNVIFVSFAFSLSVRAIYSHAVNHFKTFLYICKEMTTALLYCLPRFSLQRHATSSSLVIRTLGVKHINITMAAPSRVFLALKEAFISELGAIG